MSSFPFKRTVDAEASKHTSPVKRTKKRSSTGESQNLDDSPIKLLAMMTLPTAAGILIGVMMLKMGFKANSPYEEFRHPHKTSQIPCSQN
jgi:elongation factor P--beta-lysine ligase